MSLAGQNVRPTRKSSGKASVDGGCPVAKQRVAKQGRGIVITLHSLRQLREAFPLWMRLTIPLILLVVELIVITPLFEFKTGPMRHVADPIFLVGSMVGLVAFFLIAGEKISKIELPDSRRRLITIWAWSTIHLVSLSFFLAHSFRLQSATRQAANNLIDAALWCFLAAVVAASAVLITLPIRTLLSCLRQTVPQLSIAIVLACLMTWLTPPVRGLWTSVDGPAVHTVEWLLAWYPGEAVVREAEDGSPILGTRRVSLIVTPHCSEVDSLLAFALLGLMMILIGGRRMWNVYFLGLFFLGFGLVYFINAYRIYLMVLFGHVLGGFGYSPEACVRLAHSRIGSISLLAIATLILLLGERLSRQEWNQAKREV